MKGFVAAAHPYQESTTEPNGTSNVEVVSMKHRSLLALLLVSATSGATPCQAQSPDTGGSDAPRPGGVMIRITEVPFDRPDYVGRAERELENRFRHVAPNESLTAQVAARIRRDGTIAGARVVKSSGDSAFDNRATAALTQAT